jgi:acetyl-CoA acyltransferase
MMSRVPLGSTAGEGVGTPTTAALDGRYAGQGLAFQQGLGAEMMAQRWQLSRSQLDEFSSRSHALAAQARDAGHFDAEIVPVPLADGSACGHDQGIRPGTTTEKLAGLQPAFADDGVIHAGNSSQISDGAAGLMLMAAETARQHGLQGLALVHTAVVVGDDPVMIFGAPIPATDKVLRKAGLKVDDIGVFEVNEAFAPVPLAWQIETGADVRRLNPRGGAIALGHPLGASGARLMTTMVQQLVDHQLDYGLQTMCEGGGLANATVLERIET